MQTNKGGLDNMEEEKYQELEKIVSKFDTVASNDYAKLKDLEYSKIATSDLQNLIFLAKKGDKRALTILTKYYYPFILSIAFKYSLEKMPIDDLVSAALLGFVEGVKRYEEGYIPNKFYFYIFKSVTKEISLHFTSANIISSYYFIVYKYMKYLEMVQSGNTEKLDLSVLAKNLNIDYEILKTIAALCQNISLNDVEIPVYDLKLGDNNYRNQEDLVKIIDKYLFPRHADILKKYYDLSGKEPLTSQEIAKYCGFTSTGVDIILARCLRVLTGTLPYSELEELYYTDYIDISYRDINLHQQKHKK